MRLLEIYAIQYAKIPNESYGVKRNLSFYNLLFFANTGCEFPVIFLLFCLGKLLSTSSKFMILGVDLQCFGAKVLRTVIWQR